MSKLRTQLKLNVQFSKTNYEKPFQPLEIHSRNMRNEENVFNYGAGQSNRKRLAAVKDFFSKIANRGVGDTKVEFQKKKNPNHSGLLRMVTWQARPFTDRFGSSEADVLYQFPLVQGGNNVLLPTRCLDELHVQHGSPKRGKPGKGAGSLRGRVRDGPPSYWA